MFAVRCTRKLLNRGAPAVLDAPTAPTTVLGDWYANIIFTRPEHLVVCLSERTLLPVVVPAKDVKKLPGRIAAAARVMLLEIGVPPEAVSAEVQEMECGYLGVTASRRVLGSLNDFMFHFEYEYYARPELTLHARALRLAEMPSGAIEYAFPTEATRALFASRNVIQTAKRAG
jgi:hypothetical protein